CTASATDVAGASPRLQRPGPDPRRRLGDRAPVGFQARRVSKPAGFQTRRVRNRLSRTGYETGHGADLTTGSAAAPTAVRAGFGRNSTSKPPTSKKPACAE